LEHVRVHLRQSDIVYFGINRSKTNMRFQLWPIYLKTNTSDRFLEYENTSTKNFVRADNLQKGTFNIYVFVGLLQRW